MNSQKQKKLYFTALAIVGIVFLMLVFIGVSTFTHINMNRRHVIDSANHQGLVILQTVEAAARSVMTPESRNEEAMGRLIVEVGRNSGIEHVYLVRKDGQIVHHNDTGMNGRMSNWIPDMNEGKGYASRFRKMPDGTLVYEMAVRFAPFDTLSTTGEVDRAQSMSGKIPVHSRFDSILILSLKMTAYESARKEDIQHAIVMAVILIALASGALFFTYVIRKYHGVNRMLKASQEYTDQVTANMANGLLSINPDGGIKSYNRPALEMLGIDERNARSMNLGQVIDLDMTGITSTLTEGKPVMDREFSRSLPDGRTVDMALSVTPIRDKSKSGNGAVVIIRDLREIKHLEEKVRRSEKLAAIGKLSAMVAHEIRNPLSSIRGFARFLSHVLKDNPKDREYAEIMVQEVDRINRVVSDLLTFSRPVELRHVSADIKALIDHTSLLIESDATSASVRIMINVEEDMEPVFLDPDQMTQALLNLALNSLQELSDGNTIEIGANRDNGDQSTVIWIEDDGPGIPDELKGRVFDLFFTTRAQGTGLGLAIVQKIIEDHGGTIAVESPARGKSRGCRISIRLPDGQDQATPAV